MNKKLLFHSQRLYTFTYQVHSIITLSHFEVCHTSIDFRPLLLADLGLQLPHLLPPLGHAAHVQIDWVQEPVSFFLGVRLGHDHLWLSQWRMVLAHLWIDEHIKC